MGGALAKKLALRPAQGPKGLSLAYPSGPVHQSSLWGSQGPLWGFFRLTCFSLVWLFFLVGCARLPSKFLPSQVALGEFTGPGSEALISELSRLAPTAESGGHEARLVLSGATNFKFQTQQVQEKVTISNRYDSAWPKGLPGWDQVPEKKERYNSKEYPLTLTQASFSVDWTISDPRNQVQVSSGSTMVETKQSHGGYLEKMGLEPTDSLDRDQTLKSLAQSLADQVMSLIGPAYSSQNLASGKDSLSRKAASLAADGDWAGASSLWLEILGLNPEYGPALFNLGLYHERLGDLDKAWAFYRLAFLSVQSQAYRLALTRTADALENLGRPPRAAPPRPF